MALRKGFYLYFFHFRFVSKGGLLRFARNDEVTEIAMTKRRTKKRPSCEGLKINPLIREDFSLVRVIQKFGKLIQLNLRTLALHQET